MGGVSEIAHLRQVPPVIFITNDRVLPASRIIVFCRMQDFRHATEKVVCVVRVEALERARGVAHRHLLLLDSAEAVVVDRSLIVI